MNYGSSELLKKRYIRIYFKLAWDYMHARTCVIKLSRYIFVGSLLDSFIK
jgi:hypothetical protein